MIKYIYRDNEYYGIKWKKEDRDMLQLLSNEDVFNGTAVENLSKGVFKYAFNVQVSDVKAKVNTIGGKLC